MYCESKISHVNFGDVEHIKPKAINLFPHLEFEWNNLGICCDRCNTAKGNKYHPGAEFINPYDEDPASEILACGPLLLPKSASERGEITINEIQLNRAELIERRISRIKAINDAFSAALRITTPSVQQAALMELRKECASDKEFSMVVESALTLLEAP